MRSVDLWRKRSPGIRSNAGQGGGFRGHLLRYGGRAWPRDKSILGEALVIHRQQVLLSTPETAVDLGMANEEQVMPLVIELIGLREKVNGSSLGTIERVQRKLSVMVAG